MVLTPQKNYTRFEPGRRLHTLLRVGYLFCPHALCLPYTQGPSPTHSKFLDKCLLTKSQKRVFPSTYNDLKKDLEELISKGLKSGTVAELGHYLGAQRLLEGFSPSKLSQVSFPLEPRVCSRD